MGNLNQRLEDITQELSKCSQIKASAVIDRSGIIASCCMPHVRNKETFGAMAATMFGAADIAANEGGLGNVSRVIVQSDHGMIITEDAGSKALLSVMTEKDEKEDIPQIREKMEQIRSIMEEVSFE